MRRGTRGERLLNPYCGTGTSPVEASPFGMDLANSVRTAASAIANHSTICYVVGNRTVKGVTLPTDEFVAHAFESLGFQHREAIARNIPNKRMPSGNSPSNT